VIDVRARTVPRYKVAGELKWYPTVHGALLRHAYNLIKKRCPQTAAGIRCDPYEMPCKWHELDARYSKRVALRLVRMWRAKLRSVPPC
jgi:NADPH-dependent 2,4-dienoyl-CoA reductase/sulfur reductase-like enzyme